MIKANIEAAIEAKQKERDQAHKDIVAIDEIIRRLHEKQYKLLDKESDLYYEIEDLKEQLND